MLAPLAQQNLQTIKPLAGASAGQSSTSATAKVAHALAGTSAGQSSTSATAKVAHALAGTAAGQSAANDNASVAHALAGASSGQSSTSASLSVARPLAGSAVDQSTNSASARVAHALAGISAGQSAASASLSVSHPSRVDLSGTSLAVSAASATLRARWALGGISTARSIASADLWREPFVPNLQIFDAPEYPAAVFDELEYNAEILTMGSYIIGSTVRFQVTFTNADGALIDPSTVTLQIRPPRGPDDYPTITRVSQGVYRAWRVLEYPGTGTYKWSATGPKVDVERQYQVTNTKF